MRLFTRYMVTGEGIFPEGKFRLLDLSLGGAFFVTPTPPPLGLEVKFQLTVEGIETIMELEGRVVRHAQASGSSGFAVEFKDFSPLYQQLISDYLSKQAAV